MTALRTISFGDPTAEGDQEFLFERKCFLETDVYDRCLTLQAPLFVVGRRGSGKSATRMALARKFGDDRAVLPVVIAPQGYQFAHAKSLAKLVMSDSAVNWEFLFTSIWATVIRSAIAQELLNHYKIHAANQTDIETLRNFVADTVDVDSSVTDRLSTYLHRLAELSSENEANGEIVGRVQQTLKTLRSERIGPVIRRVAEASGIRLVLLIDSLDENWDGSNVSAQLISGLLTQCANEFASTGVLSYVFIRENMYRRVIALSARWDRIEGYFSTVNWSSSQLQTLAITRLRSSTGDETTKWNDVFEGAVDGTSTIDYMIGRTQAKPREVILFCRYALMAAVRVGETRVSAQSVKDAERTYSENRYRDLINEYKDALPELKALLDSFVARSISFSLDALFDGLRDFMSSGRFAATAPQLSLTHPNPEALFDLLLGLGFLGVRLRGSTDFVFKFYGQQGNAFGSLKDIDQIAIHPSFAVALGVTKPSDQGGELSVREAEDEDLVSASSSIAVRITAAQDQGERLLSALSSIPLGIGNFRQYEDAIRDSLAYIFTGYLDNPRIQERNWAGTQVRDIVFDNTGETLFFKLVRDRYAAVMFVFECKNKSDLDAADFHQLEARLSDATGNFGIICYRAPRLDPKRGEIEQIRSIFHRSNSKKVVLIITDKNIAQLVDRRVKGKLDKFMYRLLTRYLSSYLSS
jgi:hypothetical protein